VKQKFIDLVKKLMEEYKEEFLDSIADKISKSISEVIQREINRRVEELAKKELGIPPKEKFTEDMYYYYEDVLMECYGKVMEEVKSNVKVVIAKDVLERAKAKKKRRIIKLGFRDEKDKDVVHVYCRDKNTCTIWMGEEPSFYVIRGEYRVLDKIDNAKDLRAIVRNGDIMIKVHDKVIIVRATGETDVHILTPKHSQVEVFYYGTRKHESLS